MAELCREIEDALGAPVIEGVTAAVKWTEALVSLRLSTAKRGDYARPLAKRYDGALESFGPGADGIPEANLQPVGVHALNDADESRKSVENAGLMRVNAEESNSHIHSA
jgi:allantoin racemase